MKFVTSQGFPEELFFVSHSLAQGAGALPKGGRDGLAQNDLLRQRLSHWLPPRGECTPLPSAPPTSPLVPLPRGEGN